MISDDLNILFRKGCQLYKEHRHGAALAAFQEILAVIPDHYATLKQVGACYLALHQHGQAQAVLLSAWRQIKDDPVVLTRLGIISQAMNDIEKAAAYYQQALELDPHLTAALNNLGTIYKERNNYKEGLKLARAAVATDRDNPDLLGNLGNLLVKMNQFDEARLVLEKALESAPDNINHQVNLSAAYLADHDIDRARLVVEQALTCDSENSAANWQRALVELSAGNYSDGFRFYEWRWEKPDFQKVWPSFEQCLWDGKEQPDKTLLIWTEQGYGDTIQFSRFIDPLAHKFQKVIFRVPDKMAALFAFKSDKILIVSGAQKLPEFDCHISLISLAYHFFEGNDQLPPPINIKIPPNTDTRWKVGSERKKVGICWAGNPNHENDHNRSIPVNLIKSLVSDREIDFYSLQVGLNHTEAVQVFAEPGLIDWGNLFVDFSDTVAAVVNLDLVITVDTSIAHLAGSLTRPVLLLLPFQADWRWGLNGENTPWYPTIRIFRQDRSCTWQTVIDKVRRFLNACR